MAARSLRGGVDTEQGAPSVLYAIKQVELVVRSHLEKLLKPEGITAWQYTALTVLERRDALTSAELARHSFVTPQATADLVTALARHGLIVRRRDETHRRRLLISLTDAGRELLARYGPQVRAIEGRMLGGLTAEERAEFADCLNRCRAALAAEPAVVGRE